MPPLSRVKYVFAATDLDYSHITDLDIHVVGGQSYLYASTRYDGHVSSWNISGIKLIKIDDDAYAGNLQLGGTGSMTTINLAGGGTGLITGDGSGGALQVQTLQSNGTFGATTTLSGQSYTIDSMIHGSSVTLANGQQAVYSGIAGGSGMAQLTFDSSGTFISSKTYSDLNRTYADRIADVETVTVAGTVYVYTTSQVENGISAWRAANNGNLLAVHDMGNDEGLWITAPTGLETAQTILFSPPQAVIH